MLPLRSITTTCGTIQRTISENPMKVFMVSWVAKPTGYATPYCWTNCGTRNCALSFTATPNMARPRGAISLYSLVSIADSAWQCGQVVRMNVNTHTLPLALESEIDFPEGSLKVSSGALRTTG